VGSRGEPWYERVGRAIRDEDSLAAEQVAEDDPCTTTCCAASSRHLSRATAHRRVAGRGDRRHGYLREPLDAIAVAGAEIVATGVRS